MSAALEGAGKLVLLDVTESVATITLNRPEKLNALSAELLEELVDALVRVEESTEVGAVVITGSAATKRPAFAAGADIGEMAAMDAMALRRHARLGQTACNLIEGMPKPVVAAVNGFALGGGCELAMACHFRYAAKGALFGQPEINLGIIPGFGGTQRLVRIVGRGPAIEMLLGGDPIDADEALRLGLVNRVVEPAALIEAAMATARKLAAKAPVARSLILDAVTRGVELDLESAQALEADLFGLAGTTEDVREGMKAFLEKRPAAWKGR